VAKYIVKDFCNCFILHVKSTFFRQQVFKTLKCFAKRFCNILFYMYARPNSSVVRNCVVKCYPGARFRLIYNALVGGVSLLPSVRKRYRVVTRRQQPSYNKPTLRLVNEARRSSQSRCSTPTGASLLRGDHVASSVRLQMMHAHLVR